jgi:hypothetical protein
VLAQARLGDEASAEDPGGFGAVATLVLWSVQPALAGRAAPRQAHMVQRIDEGLASIDHSSVDTQRWQAVLRQLRTIAQFTASGSAPHISEPVPLPPRTDTWLAPLEVHDSGFVHEFASSLPEPASQEPPESLPPLDLQHGAWVELLGERWERWQLTWASPHGLLFLFTQGGGVSRSMTRRRLQHMMAEGTLRLVTAHGVVDGALDAVAQVAWHNSLYGGDLA